MDDSGPLFCRVEEAAKVLGYSNQQVRWFASCGYLKHASRGSGCRILVKGIHEFRALWFSDWPAGATPDGYIYLMQYSRFHKIGFSKNVQRRLNDLNASLPVPTIALVHSIPTNNMRAAELKLHTLFTNRRINREWFQFGPKEIELIQQCKALIM